MGWKLLDIIKNSHRIVLVLSVDTTFGGETQIMGLAHAESGGFEVAWWRRAFESSDDTAPRHAKLPAPDERKQIEIAAAEELLGSLIGVPVSPYVRNASGVDDGTICVLHVRNQNGYAELEWNAVSVPKEWESAQRWFCSAWNQMRSWLALPDAHEAFDLGRSSNDP